MIQRASLAPTTYKVPERSGEVLIDPPPARLPALLEAARARDWGRAEILGVPLREFRAKVRARALSLAGGAVPGGAPSSAPPLVVMGHQPVFFHPGVWIKFFLLTHLHERLGVTGLHLLVDNDAAGPITVEVPEQGDHLIRRAEALLELSGDVPLEAVPLPTEREWETFCGRVREHLRTLASAEVRACFDAFVACAAPVRAPARTLGHYLAAARRSYEATAAPPRYLEVAVSALSDTPEFGAFALHLLQDAAGFRGRYNGSLDEYRVLHRLRSAANPFPNLDETGGYVEAPFWVVREGRRASLYVQRAGDRLRLRTSGEAVLDLPAGPAGVDALRASAVRIRPKALTLTMFARLCLGDLFIHGVGGGRYDRVTDAMIGEVFECPPPPYVVATATLMLPLLGGDVVEDGRALERRLMELQHNPERHLASPSGAQRRLIEEKWSLIRAVEQMRPGPERRTATHRIREINAQLAQALAGEIHQVQAKRAAAGRASASFAAASYRGYPFFLFDPARVAALVADGSTPPA